MGRNNCVFVASFVVSIAPRAIRNVHFHKLLRKSDQLLPDIKGGCCSEIYTKRYQQ